MPARCLLGACDGPRPAATQRRAASSTHGSRFAPCLPSGLQASYAMGRSSRPHKVAAQSVTTADPAVSDAEPATPGTAARAAPVAAEDEAEELLPPPEPPLILPSTAAAVRTKERQLAPTGVGGAVHEGEEDEDLDAAADAALGQQEQGPGLVQRAMDAASSAAAGAYAAAAPVVKQAVTATADLAASGLGMAAGAAEAVAEAAGPEDDDTVPPGEAEGQQTAATAPVEATPTGPMRPRDAAATLAAAEHAAAAAPRAAPAHHKAAAAVTTAAVLPASAAAPAATGHGYFPTVGATAPAPAPEPTISGGQARLRVCMSKCGPLRNAMPSSSPTPPCTPSLPGALSAKRVVAERLTGLAEQARIPPAAPAGPASQAGRAGGKAPRGAPGMVRGAVEAIQIWG